MNFKRSEPILCFFSGNIFDCNLNTVHLHGVSTQTSYLSGFFNISFGDGWSEQAMSLDLHVADKALSV